MNRLTLVASLVGAWVVAGVGSAAEADAWQRAAPVEVRMDASLLESLTRHLKASPELNVHSLLVVKNGVLAYEEYFSGTDEDWGQSIGSVDFGPDTLHDLRSVSKTVTSLLVGIAIDRGLIPSVDTRVIDLLPAYADSASDAARELRVRDLLTMSAGLEWNESIPYSNPLNSEIAMTVAAEPIQYVLRRPGVTAPGSVFNYNGGLTTVLAGILEKRTGARLAAWATEVLFDPLGIDRFVWHEHANGLALPASGLRLTPRAMAKLGQLALNGGRFGDRQVVSRDWIDRSTTSAIAANPFVGYGYQWWVQRYSWGGEEHSVPLASGNGGQRIFLLREFDAVVVVTAGKYNAQSIGEGLVAETLLMDYLLPALGSGPVESDFRQWVRAAQIGAGIAALSVLVGIVLGVRMLRRRRAAPPASP